ncbi:camp-dependent protein kinase catalytic subunit [Cladochytrium tenue]|nr:camp-dependent protein kinase catalytic subunit [Cladochytrium tenue]
MVASNVKATTVSRKGSPTLGGTSADDGSPELSSQTVWDRLSTPRHKQNVIAGLTKSRDTSLVPPTMTSGASTTSSTPRISSVTKKTGVPPKPTLHRQKSTPNLSTKKRLDAVASESTAGVPLQRQGSSKGKAVADTTTTATSAAGDSKPAPRKMLTKDATLHKRKSESDMKAKAEFRLKKPTPEKLGYGSKPDSLRSSNAPRASPRPSTPVVSGTGKPIRPSSPATPTMRRTGVAQVKRRLTGDHKESALHTDLTALNEDGGQAEESEQRSTSTLGDEADSKSFRSMKGHTVKEPKTGEGSSLDMLREEEEDDEIGDLRKSSSPAMRHVKQLRWDPTVPGTESFQSSISTNSSSTALSAVDSAVFVSRDPSPVPDIMMDGVAISESTPKDTVPSVQPLVPPPVHPKETTQEAELMPSAESTVAPATPELSTFETAGLVPPSTPSESTPSLAAEVSRVEDVTASPDLSCLSLPSNEKMALADLNLIRCVGSGSFGRVHLAVHRTSGVRVALKSLVKTELVRLKQVEHTLSEKEALEAVNTSSIAHTFGYESSEQDEHEGFPFVVKLLATFQDPLRVYFVLEHVAGGELFNLLRRREKLEDREARFYSCEVALAIEHLHALGIVYRDLKPENVLLDANGHVKLVDFGFAKILPQNGETYTLCGTPEYLAPEVIQPVSPTGGYSLAVDWWSFGVLVYEMIAGHPPFFVDPPAEGEGEDGVVPTESEGDEDAPPVPLELYRKILDGRVGYPPWMSPVAKDLIRRLLVVDPARRLGARLGDVESHPWFDGVDWDLVIARRWEAPPAGPEELRLAAQEFADADIDVEDDDLIGDGSAAPSDDATDPNAEVFADF